MAYMNKSKTDVWATPPDLLEELRQEFGELYDPCPVVKEFRMFDALGSSWGQRNFINPPYSEWGKWVKKGYEESLKGKLCIFLLPVRTDTEAFHSYINGKAEIRFIKGRLRFGNSPDPAPFPSMIVIFKPQIPKEQRRLA